MARRHSQSLNLLHWFAAAFLVLAVTPRAKAGEMYYLLMFAQQQYPNNINYSHTFATFVKLSWHGNGACPAAPCLEAHTISWLPRSMRLRAWALLPECGSNFDLHTTLRWGQGNGMLTSLWGPYAIQPELYRSAVQQASLLESEQVLYKLIDLGYCGNQACNCVHAVSSVVAGHRRSLGDIGWGDSASFRVLCRMEPWVIHPFTVHAWVGSALGLDRYPILYRDWSNAPSGVIAGPLYRLLGSESLQPTYGRPAR
jgi:hypothetical protein